MITLKCQGCYEQELELVSEMRYANELVPYVTSTYWCPCCQGMTIVCYPDPKHTYFDSPEEKNRAFDIPALFVRGDLT